jgi:hypothetical protein
VSTGVIAAQGATPGLVKVSSPWRALPFEADVRRMTSHSKVRRAGDVRKVMKRATAAT